MKRIDPTQGPRADLYAHFRGFAQPLYTLCARVDVGPVLARGRAQGGGTFAVLLRQAMAAANAVPQLRQRIRVEAGAEVVVEHERVHCTCTVARADESFQFCWFPFLEGRLESYTDTPARARVAAASEGLDLGQQGRDDLLYLTCIPWLDFTQIQHAESGFELDCVPRIAWGKLVEGHVTFCLTSHHSLVDGRHAARFFERLTDPELDP